MSPGAAQVKKSLDSALEIFVRDLAKHDWVASTALSKGSEDQTLELTRHRPMAVEQFFSGCEFDSMMRISHYSGQT